MRPTHSNMIFPGPGIGGYCLPKDAGLGYWAYKHILGFEDGDQVFKISPTAVDINDTRALHVAELTRDALRNMGRYIAGADVLICGASYRQDVGDTRYSGSEMVVRKLTEMGAEMRVHDPYVDHWYELEKQDVYPAPGHSWSRFFRNQEGLKDIRVQKDLAAALKHAEALILAVPHEQYLNLDPDADRQVGRRPAGGDRLLRHPLRRQDPPLLRARLRSQSPRPRPHPADQGAGAVERQLSRVFRHSGADIPVCPVPVRPADRNVCPTVLSATGPETPDESTASPSTRFALPCVSLCRSRRW